MPNDPLREETVEGSGGTATPIIKRKPKNVRKVFLNESVYHCFKNRIKLIDSNSLINNIFDFDLIIIRLLMQSLNR